MKELHVNFNKPVFVIRITNCWGAITYNVHARPHVHANSSYRLETAAPGRAAGRLSLWLLEEGLCRKREMQELIHGFTQADQSHFVETKIHLNIYCLLNQYVSLMLFCVFGWVIFKILEYYLTCTGQVVKIRVNLWDLEWEQGINCMTAKFSLLPGWLFQITVEEYLSTFFLYMSLEWLI